MFKNLLLAVDVTDEGSASNSVEAAVKMARIDGGTLHLLNVVPDTGMAIVGASLAPDHMEKVMETARAEMAAWAAAHIPDDISHQVHVAEGTVYDQIIQVAGTLGVDAIVVGAHRPEFRDYLIGPNAARVARHADQSVFVVR